MGRDCGQASRVLKNTVKPATLFFSVAHVIVRLGAESSQNACEEAVKKAFPLYLGHGSNRKYALR